MGQKEELLIGKNVALWLGVSGILGGLVLFAGDMLFYFNGEQTDYVSNMGQVSDGRIIASGICALIAAWLYTLASGQIYYAFQTARKWVRLTLFFSFAAIMITYGVVHGAFVAIATSARIAVELGMSADAYTSLAVTANNALRLLAYIPFGVFTLLFVVTVWQKQSCYPRWVILFTPAIPFLLSGVITESLDGAWRVIIGGGFLNLILIVFFASSTLALFFTKTKHQS